MTGPNDVEDSVTEEVEAPGADNEAHVELVEDNIGVSLRNSGRSFDDNRNRAIAQIMRDPVKRQSRYRGGL